MAILKRSLQEAGLDGDVPDLSKRKEGPDMCVSSNVEILDNVADYPILATAPGLSLTPDVVYKVFAHTAESLNLDKTKLRGTTDLRPKPTALFLHARAHAKLDVCGNELTHATPDGYFKHYVGVFDPGSAELKVIPAHKLNFYASPVTTDAGTGSTTLESGSALDNTQQQQQHQQQLAENVRNARQMREDLGSTFGNKKMKKIISTRQESYLNRSMTDENAEVRGKLESAILENMAETGVNIPDKSILNMAISEAKPVPRANLSAQRPDQIYTAVSLLGEQILHNISLKPWQESFSANKPIDTCSIFVAHRLRGAGLPQVFGVDHCEMDSVASSTVMAQAVERLKLLRYLLFLIELYHVVSRSKTSAKRSAKRWPKPEVFKKMYPGTLNLVECSRSKFSNDGEITRWHIDLIITHAAALALLIDGLTTNFYHLKHDLGLENKAMTQYYRELGCQVTRVPENQYEKYAIRSKAEAAVHRIAQLKCPPEFPRQRMSTLRSRRRI